MYLSPREMVCHLWQQGSAPDLWKWQLQCFIVVLCCHFSVAPSFKGIHIINFPYRLWHWRRTLSGTKSLNEVAAPLLWTCARFTRKTWFLSLIPFLSLAASTPAVTVVFTTMNIVWDQLGSLGNHNNPGKISDNVGDSGSQQTHNSVWGRNPSLCDFCSLLSACVESICSRAIFDYFHCLKS